MKKIFQRIQCRLLNRRVQAKLSRLGVPDIEDQLHPGYRPEGVDANGRFHPDYLPPGADRAGW